MGEIVNPHVVPYVAEMPVVIPEMTPGQITLVRNVEIGLLEIPQKPQWTGHQIHHGIYTRTICIPAGDMITGALIKVATTLILNGDASVFLGTEWVRYIGHCVLYGSAGRKQAFYAIAPTFITTSFRTNARTVEQAEKEFTDDAHMLWSRRPGALNDIVITGE